MGKYKVIIAGCRDFSNYALLAEKCDYYLHDKIQTHEVIIVSGHAKGADTLGEKYAQERGLNIELHLQTGIVMDEQPDPSGTRKWLLKLMLSLHFGMAKAVERLT